MLDNLKDLVVSIEVEEWAILSNNLFVYRPNNKDDMKLWLLESGGAFSVESFSPKLILQPAALDQQKSDVI